MTREQQIPTTTMRLRAQHDRLTVAQRLELAMASHTPTLDREALLARCEAICRELDPHAASLVSAGFIDRVLRGEIEESALFSILAEACGVRAVWLSWGIGPMHDETTGGPGHA